MCTIGGMDLWSLGIKEWASGTTEISCWEKVSVDETDNVSFYL